MTRTNAYSLLCMIIRAVAVWSLAKVAIALPGSVAAYRNMGSEFDFAPGVVLAAAAVGLLIIAALWLFADKLAKLALVRPQDLVFESRMDPATWLGLLLSAMGAWFCFQGVVSAIYQIVRWMALLRFGHQDNPVFPDVWADIVATAMQLILGAVLVLRGQGLSRWIHRLRYGVEPVAADPAD